MFATLIGLIQAYLGWDQNTQMASVGFILTVQIFTATLIASLVLLVSRRRSNIAKWIQIVMFVLGIPLVYKFFTEGMLHGSAWITALQTIGQLPRTVCCLARPPVSGLAKAIRFEVWGCNSARLCHQFGRLQMR
ncbi:hypothetical protein WBP07_22745 (plasmid) [Novosphingobium sp. BL-8A]